MLIHNKKNILNFEIFSKFSKSSLLKFVFLLIMILSSVYVGAYLYKTGKMTQMKDKILSTPDRLISNFNSYFNDSPKIYIDIGFKELKRIEYTRRRNVFNSVIGSYKSEDWVPAKIKYNGATHNIKMRLKGIGDAHWMHGYKWSYRIKIKGNDALLGMKKMTMQQHHLRGSLLEWVFMKMLHDADLISHRLSFHEVILNGDSLGIYAIQEQYDKLLIENNKRREGPILGFSKDVLFAEISRGFTEGDVPMVWEDSFYRAPLDVTSNKYLSSPLTQKGFQMLEGFRRGELKTSDVFDYKSLAKLTAIRALLGSSEFDWRDIKFYMNPVTMKLEPIGREVHVLERRTPYWWLVKDDRVSQDGADFHRQLFSDQIFYNEYLKELYLISEPSFLINFYKKYGSELYKLESSLNKFDAYEFPYGDIIDRSKIIKRALNPLQAVSSYIVSANEKGVTLKVGATQPFPVRIDCMVYRDKPLLCPEHSIIVDGKVSHKAIDYQEIKMKWVDLSVDVMQIVDKINLNYKVIGNPENKTANIGQWNIDSVLIEDLPMRSTNIDDIDWISIDHSKKTIHILEGDRLIETTLIFPKGYTTSIGSNTKLFLKNKASLIFQGAIVFEGEKGDPVMIRSLSKNGGGVAVLGARARSKLNNVVFLGLSSVEYNGLELSGAVTFYESDIDISNVKFSENYKGDDFLNIVRSEFSVTDSSFEKILSDAIDSDFSNGVVLSTSFKDIGNDALDFSNSEASLSNIVITNSKDKAISVGERSNIELSGISIKNSHIGVASKDESVVLVNNIQFSNVVYNAAAYQKKPEFGPSKIVINNFSDAIDNSKYIVDDKSKIIFNKDKDAIILQNVNSNEL